MHLYYVFATRQHWRRRYVLGCPVVPFVRSFGRPVRYCYHDIFMNGLNHFNKTDKECLIDFTDNLIRFYSSKVKVI